MSAQRTEPVVSQLQPRRLGLGKAGWLVSLALLTCVSLPAFTQNAVQSSIAAKRPEAKTRQERDDFNRAYALTGGAACETAANTFAVRYPDSELRRYLYS